MPPISFTTRPSASKLSERWHNRNPVALRCTDLTGGNSGLAWVEARSTFLLTRPAFSWKSWTATQTAQRLTRRVHGSRLQLFRWRLSWSGVRSPILKHQLEGELEFPWILGARDHSEIGRTKDSAREVEVGVI
jgi:hypothetical protein